MQDRKDRRVKGLPATARDEFLSELGMALTDGNQRRCAELVELLGGQHTGGFPTGGALRLLKDGPAAGVARAALGGYLRQLAGRDPEGFANLTQLGFEHQELLDFLSLPEQLRLAGDVSRRDDLAGLGRATLSSLLRHADRRLPAPLRSEWIDAARSLVRFVPPGTRQRMLDEWLDPADAPLRKALAGDLIRAGARFPGDFWTSSAFDQTEPFALKVAITSSLVDSRLETVVAGLQSFLASGAVQPALDDSGAARVFAVVASFATAIRRRDRGQIERCIAAGSPGAIDDAMRAAMLAVVRLCGAGKAEARQIVSELPRHWRAPIAQAVLIPAHGRDTGHVAAMEALQAWALDDIASDQVLLAFRKAYPELGSAQKSFPLVREALARRLSAMVVNQPEGHDPAWLRELAFAAVDLLELMQDFLLAPQCSLAARQECLAWIRKLPAPSPIGHGQDEGPGQGPQTWDKTLALAAELIGRGRLPRNPQTGPEPEGGPRTAPTSLSDFELRATSLRGKLKAGDDGAWEPYREAVVNRSAELVVQYRRQLTEVTPLAQLPHEFSRLVGNALNVPRKLRAASLAALHAAGRDNPAQVPQRVRLRDGQVLNRLLDMAAGDEASVRTFLESVDRIRSQMDGRLVGMPHDRSLEKLEARVFRRYEDLTKPKAS